MMVAESRRHAAGETRPSAMVPFARPWPSRTASSARPTRRRPVSASFTTDLCDLADRQLVVEAVVEDEAVKLEVFTMLDKMVADHARHPWRPTQSSIPIMKLGMATQRPENVIGIHFFNPVPVLKLVELVTSLLTS